MPNQIDRSMIVFLLVISNMLVISIYILLKRLYKRPKEPETNRNAFDLMSNVSLAENWIKLNLVIHQIMKEKRILNLELAEQQDEQIFLLEIFMDSPVCYNFYEKEHFEIQKAIDEILEVTNYDEYKLEDYYDIKEETV